MARKRPTRRKRPTNIRTRLPVPEREKCLQRWRAWIRRIKSEVGDLIGRREIFLGVRAIVDLNPQVGEPNAFVHWMIQNYVEATSVGVRRLCDARNDVESLSRLLRELLEYPGVLSLQSHERLYPARLRAQARGTFERLVGVGRTKLSSRHIRGDLRRLEDAEARIHRFVNKRVAHAAPSRDLRRNPTYGQLGQAIATLNKLTVKYLVLLTGDGYDTCAPVRQYDWRKVLLRAWIDQDDLRELNAMS